jgi:hypothetical protein
LKTKNLQEFTFLSIRRIRTKALLEARIEHAKSSVPFGASLPRHPDLPRGRLRLISLENNLSIGKRCGVFED